MIDDIVSYVLTTIFKGTIYSGMHRSLFCAPRRESANEARPSGSQQWRTQPSGTLSAAGPF